MIAREHVFDDLHPYVNTAEDEDSPIMFSDFQDWSHNEIQNSWWRLRCEICRLVAFRWPEELEAHLKEDHEEECKDALLTRIVDDAKQRRSMVRRSMVKMSACPFCDPSQKDGDAAVDRRVFVAHVAMHMEKLAFCSPYPELSWDKHPWSD